MSSKKKLGISLGGGGARGFCHIGVLEALHSHGIRFDIVTGCSMGALVGSAYVTDLTFEQMKRVAKNTNTATVFDIEFKSRQGFARGERALKVYKQLVGNTLIEDCKIKFAATATDLITGQLCTITRGPIWKAARASMSIPGAFVPVIEGERVLVDGGVMERIPIEAARGLGADFVIAVDCLGGIYENPSLNSMFDVIERSYLILDYKCAKNEAMDADFLITPELGNKSLYKFSNNLRVIEQGKEAVERVLPALLEKLKDNGFEFGE